MLVSRSSSASKRDGVVRTAQDLDPSALAPLLHRRPARAPRRARLRRAPGRRPRRGTRATCRPGPPRRAAIVSRAPAATDRRVHVGEDDAQRIRATGKVLRPRAEATSPRDVLGGRRAGRQHAHERRAGRRDELPRSVRARADAMPLEQLQRRGRGHGQDAVRGAHGAVARADDAAAHVLHAELRRVPRCAPTTSRIASTAPTSCRCTSAGGMPWISPSDAAIDQNARSARSRTSRRRRRRGDELADLIDVAPVRLRRDVEVDLPAHDLAAQHLANVDAHVRRVPCAQGSARSHSGSSPTPSSAPSVMSPEMPLNGSRMAVRMR